MMTTRKPLYLLAGLALSALAGCWDTYDREDRVKDKEPPTYTNVGWNDKDKDHAGTSENK